ncbi:alpha/beta hydrolase [Ascidiimonas aurantiaca]|uniref:alpha/beta fold hydrolase n=1 Tax=Ascidiimonas aurantiaca TaxID=1685432 RepID=UPI0030ED117D
MSSENKNASYRQDIQVPKPIIYTGQLLQTFSKKWASRYAARLFITPMKHPMPKREFEMDRSSNQYTLQLPESQKEIVVYEYGDGPKTALLVHGWSGRGTQLVKIAEALLAQGYKTVSFDAPAHGKAKGRTTNLREFIEAVLLLDKKTGPFDIGVGHSLGGMTLLNAVRMGISLQKIAIVGSGDIVTDIMDDFVSKLELKPEIRHLMQYNFENTFGEPMNNYAASEAAKKVQAPVLVVHDENDVEVPVSSAKNIVKHLPNGELFITRGLGHRKILGNGTVIDKIISFIHKS